MKVAIVSGGTNGIGKAIVHTLLNEGYVVATFSRDKAKCEALQKELEGKNALVLVGDVASDAAVAAIVQQTVEEFKRVDVLVNNAGVGYWTPADEGDIAKFRNMLDINTVGLAALTKYVIPIMKQQGSGQIVNISSVSGKKGYAGGSFYCATKHAVMGYSESLRMELKPHGIKVCTICPGMVLTDLHPEEVRKNRLEQTGGGIMAPEDIARLVQMVVTQSEHASIEDISINAF